MRIFLLAILCPILISAQTIELSFPPNLNGAKLQLIGFEGLHEMVLDSTIVTDQSAIIKYEIPQDGLAKLMLNGTSLGELIILKETPLNGTLSFATGSINIRWQESLENVALIKLLERSVGSSEAIEQISGLMEGIPQFHPKREAITDSLQTQYRTLLGTYNSSLAELQKNYPSTYTAQILIGLDALPMREERPEWLANFDNDPAFLHQHFFENVNFSDSRTASNPFLKNKIVEYIFTYIEKHEQGLKNGIDLIMTKADRNEAVKKACAEVLIGFFTDQGISEYVDYLNQEHLESCSIEFDPSIGEILKRSSPYRVGEKVASTMIQDFAKGEVNLLSSESEFTALMFWASWCSHCHEEIPQLENFLALNFEQLSFKAISLDSLKQDLTAAQTAFPSQVEQLCSLKGWDSSPAIQFGISATPSFILIKKDGSYLGRASSLVSLAMLLAEQK
ncbi:MAG: thiol-disulfide isomerase/thioredoxin [Bacteroidia bacterium]|jgi:thiol-disulfide isomerase/thioredoxin